MYMMVIVGVAYNVMNDEKIILAYLVKFGAESRRGKRPLSHARAIFCTLARID